MLTLIRRLLTLLLLAFATAAATLWWLHDGDLEQAVDPVLREWDAAALAKRAGLGEAPTEPSEER